MNTPRHVQKKNSLLEIDSIFSKKPKIWSKPNVMKTYTVTLVKTCVTKENDETDCFC